MLAEAISTRLFAGFLSLVVSVSPILRGSWLLRQACNWTCPAENAVLLRFVSHFADLLPSSTPIFTRPNLAIPFYCFEIPQMGAFQFRGEL